MNSTKFIGLIGAAALAVGGLTYVLLSNKSNVTY
jgi:hypothetical protein